MLLLFFKCLLKSLKFLHQSRSNKSTKALIFPDAKHEQCLVWDVIDMVSLSKANFNYFQFCALLALSKCNFIIKAGTFQKDCNLRLVIRLFSMKSPQSSLLQS